VTWSGTATGIACSVTGSGATYTVNATASSTGTLIPSIAANVCISTATGALNAASTSTDHSVTVSNATPGPITVTAPAAGTFWGAGTSHEVTWTAPLVAGNVSIYLYDYNPSSSGYGTLVQLASGVPAAQGSWTWAIPSGQVSNNKLRIRVVGKSLAGFSGAFLEIGQDDAVPPTVTNLAPVSDQINPAPTPSATYPIQFTVQFSETVTGFTIDDVSWVGSTASDITAVLTGSGSAYLIKVVNSGTGTLTPSVPAGVCTDAAQNPNTASPQTPSVTVAGPAPTTFAVTAPATAAYWAAGTAHQITWDGSLLTGTVSIDLCDYNGNAATNSNYGKSVQLASDLPAVLGSWSWTVPSAQASGANYKVRVLATGAAGSPAPYSGYFEIGPDTPFLRITGTQLNTGAPTFASGTVVTIPWLAYRATGTLSVYLYDYTLSSPTGTLLQSSVPVVNGTWLWSVPADLTVGGMYKLRLYQSSTIGDFSDVYFSVGTGTPSAVMVTPNGGEVWTRGNTYSIAVATNCASGLLSVYMYDYSTGAGETIAASSVKAQPTGTSTLNWTIPPNHVTGSKWKMRVVNGSGTLSDFSNNYFTIK